MGQRILIGKRTLARCPPREGGDPVFTAAWTRHSGSSQRPGLLGHRLRGDDNRDVEPQRKTDADRWIGAGWTVRPL